MSKYEPLWEYIKKNNKSNLTFSQIEKILGFEIDHSFLRYKKELKEYGYTVLKISKINKTVLFAKID